MKSLPVIALLLSLVALFVAFTHNSRNDDVKELVFANVLKTGVLRCGYTSFEPLVTIDPNTKEMSGINYEIVTEAAKRLGLKVNWVEDVPWSDIAVGLKSNRFDAFCTGLWPGSNRARNTLFTTGIFFDPVAVFVRADDARFTDDPLKLNDPAYTLAYAEGDATEAMIKARLPLAKGLPLTGFSSIGELFSQVTTKKADASLGTRITGVQFMEANPGLIKEVVPKGRPFRIQPVTLGLPEGEYGLKKMLDATIFEMQDDGTVDRIVKKYVGGREGMLYRQKIEYEPL